MLRSLLDAYPSAALLVDPSGHILAANRQVANVLGKTPSEVEGLNTAILAPEEIQANRKLKGMEAIHSRAPVRFEEAVNGRILETIINPVTDDMAMCPPLAQKGNGKLTALDAENGWFIRVDHIKNYGTDPDIESRSIHPKTPLLFLNIEAQPDSTALLWEHIEDAPGTSCPNPRVIIPRKCVPSIVNKPVSVDIRSFGVRTPPCTRENPTYGILGLFHILPPALAWIWRLVSPRGHDNPSIINTEGMSSEGVGSYWPFATGLKINHANLLLKQITDNPRVHYSISPVKHVGAWNVGFMPLWIMREYISRRGGIRFTREELSPSRCTLLGYSVNKLVVESQMFDIGYMKVEHQPEVGIEAYDKGAKSLTDYFKAELRAFNQPELDPLGRKIIDCFEKGGSMQDFESMIETETIFLDD